MAAEEKFILTREGYERLQAELAEYEAEDRTRRDQMEAMYRDVDRTNDEEAADFEVRTMKEFTDERIGHLKFVLERAEVIEQDPDPLRINVGDRVIVWDLEARQEQAFNLVDGEESGVIDHAVTTDSPVGQALLGHTLGDTIEVNVPDGWARYTVRRLERITD